MMKTRWWLDVTLVIGVLTAACGSESSGKGDITVDVSADRFLDPDQSSSRLDNLGTVRVVAHYDGEVPEGVKVAVVLFECPFSMPPVAHGEYVVTDGFPAVGDLPYVPPGHYCVMAYIDMVADDGTHPVPGVDAEAFPDEGKTTIEVGVFEGKVTELDLYFQFSEEMPVDGEPGPEDVWLHVRIMGEDCPEGGRFVLYGKTGEALEGMPEFYYQKAFPVYPFITVIPESDLLGMKSPFPAEVVTLGAYHDVDAKGMGPEAGDPAAPHLTVELQKGILNKMVFRLK